MKHWVCRPKKPPALPCAPNRLSDLKAELLETVDPLGGSYFVESLTNSMESAAWESDSKY